MKFKPHLIEPLILPLVNAINNTGLFKTFSSCEGHFKEEDQISQDRTKADVRFDLRKSTSKSDAEDFIHYIITNYGNVYANTFINAYKLYVPKMKGQADFVFVIEIRPFDRFESVLKKRNYTNKGIKTVTKLVKSYTRTKLKKAA